MGFLQGKRALITGVASDRSIATGIAEAMHREGAELAFTYQGEKLLSRVEACAARTNAAGIFPCDVAEDASILLGWLESQPLVRPVHEAAVDMITRASLELPYLRRK